MGRFITILSTCQIEALFICPHIFGGIYIYLLLCVVSGRVRALLIVSTTVHFVFQDKHTVVVLKDY